MPEGKSAVEAFLQDTEQTPFTEESKELFADKVVSETAEGANEVEESKPLPFHKDPKVQRYVEKQIAKALEGVRPASNEPTQRETEIEVPDSLVRLIGNDTDEKKAVLKDFSKYLGSLKEDAAKLALQEFQQQAEQATAEDRRAQDELDEYFEEIEDTYGVDLSSNAPTSRKQRADFIEYVRKIAPKNEDGEVAAFPDLVAAYEEFQDKQKRSAPVSRAKELASRSMSRSGEATTATKAGNSWKDVEKLFSRLSN